MRTVSIIIVTYNGLHETTASCLESIFAMTAYVDYEVIVVDNNSSDGTPAYLEKAAGEEKRLRCILNTSNRGFAGGNNDGIRAARGDVIVLLNNDTLVTEGWLEPLVDALEDGSVGLVGPVTNSAGNEQRIYTSGQTPEEILEEGRRWAAMSAGDRFEADRLGFFCVATRRDLIDEVGLLDEAFGLGFYEDDDYCIRVMKAGYRLVCIEDVFVYHRGSATFGKMPKANRKLMKRNRRLLESKFAARYTIRHSRERQLDLVESYLARLAETGDRVLAKARYRMMLAATLTPRGIFKRLIFMRRFQKLANALEG